MITPELIEYIKAWRSKGVSEDSIKQTLVSNGWNSADIDQGFRAIGLSAPAQPVQVPPELLNYIKGRRASNIPDETIRQTLVGGGWIPADIDQGFQVLNSGTFVAGALPEPAPPTPSGMQTQPAGFQGGGGFMQDTSEHEIIPVSAVVQRSSIPQQVAPGRPQKPLGMQNKSSASFSGILQSEPQAAPEQPPQRASYENFSGFQSRSGSMVSSTFAPTGPAKPERSYKWLWITIIFSLIIAGAIYAYARGMFSIPSLNIGQGGQEPEEVLAAMVNNLKEVDTVSFAVVFDGKGQTNDLPLPSGTIGAFGSPTSPSIETQVTLTGVFDAINPDDPRFRMTLNSDVDKGTTKTNINVELRYVASVLYGQLVQGSGFELSFRPFLGKWMSMDQEELSEELGRISNSNLPASSSNVTSLVGSYLGSFVSAFQKHLSTDVTRVFPKTTINGTSMYHYQLEVDKASLVAIAQELSRGNTPFVDAAWIANFQQSLASFNGTTIELWIGARDLLPYKIMYDFEVDKPDLDLNGTVTISFGNYNEPVSVSPPANAQSLTDFVEQLIIEAIEQSEI